MACPRLTGAILCPVPSRLCIEIQNTKIRHAEWEAALETGELGIPEDENECMGETLSDDEWLEIEECDNATDSALNDHNENEPRLVPRTTLLYGREPSADGQDDDDWTSVYSDSKKFFRVAGYYAAATAETLSPCHSYGSEIFADHDDFLSDGTLPPPEIPTHQPRRARCPEKGGTPTNTRTYWLNKDVRVMITPKEELPSPAAIPTAEAGPEHETQGKVHEVKFAKAPAHGLENQGFKGDTLKDNSTFPMHRRENSLQFLMRSSNGVVSVRERIQRAEAMTASRSGGGGGGGGSEGLRRA